MKKVIVCGSRNFNNYELLEQTLFELYLDNEGILDIEIVSGGQNTYNDETKETYGADFLGEQFAHNHKLPVRKFPANWKEYGKAAGPVRNSEMADYATGCVAFWDGISTGTADMIKRAAKKRLDIHVIIFKS